MVEASIRTFLEFTRSLVLKISKIVFLEKPRLLRRVSRPYLGRKPEWSVKKSAKTIWEDTGVLKIVLKGYIHKKKKKFKVDGPC